MKGKNTSNNRQLLIKVLIRFVLAIILIGLTVFLPAGSIKFWEAWVYMGILFTPMIFVLNISFKERPRIIRTSNENKRKRRTSKSIR